MGLGLVPQTHIQMQIVSGASRLQGSLTPGPWTCTYPWPVRNGAALQEVSGGPVREASSDLRPLPSDSITTSAPSHIIRY